MLIPGVLGKLVACAAGSAHFRFDAVTGIRLERDEQGRPLAIATDGEILLVAEWDEPAASEPDPRRPGFATVVPPQLWRAAARWAKAANPGELDHGHFAVAEGVGPGSLSIQADGTTLVGKPVEGRYPDWREVMPAAAPDYLDAEAHHGKHVRVTLSVPLLSRLCEALSELGLDDVEFDVPVNGKGQTGGRVRFAASAAGGGGVRVRGVLVQLTVS